MEGPRYPESQSPLRAELVERYQRFAELREDFLLGYGYNTARAYWGDLEHINDWCLENELDVMRIDDHDLTTYLDSLQHRGYSPSTVRRRRSTLGLFQRHVVSEFEC